MIVDFDEDNEATVEQAENVEPDEGESNHKLDNRMLVDMTTQDKSDQTSDNQPLNSQLNELDERSQIVEAEREEASKAMEVQADRMLQSSNSR